MTEENSENKNLKNYLLGLFEERDREQIEERLMTDDGYFQALLIEEDELIREYINETLSEKEYSQFETRFLISDERRKKLNFARTLQRKAGERLEENRNGQNSSKLQKVSSGIFLKRYFLMLFPKPVSVLLILIAVIGIIWLVLFYSSRNGVTSLELEFTKLNKMDFGETEKYADFSRLNLLSGDTRSSGNTEVLSGQKLTDKVFFRLALPIQPNPKDVFSVELSSQKVIFTQKQLPSYKNMNGTELRFLAPSSILKKGDYKIRVMDEKNNETVYVFSVE